MTDFVHLHLHSEYSLLDGVCRIKEIPRKAKELGQSAVALTDHGVMYGCVEFFEACKNEGVKPIIGCEVYVAENTLDDKTGENGHLVLLCKNETGYKNLCKIVSKAFKDGFFRKPRTDINELKKYSEGLVALSGCLSGRIPRLLLDGKHAEARAYARELNSVFGQGNFYLELQDHGIEGQRMVNECLLAVSDNTGVPVVCTNDVHYLNPDDAQTQRVMTCIQTGSTLSDEALGFRSNEHYMKSGDEMASLFSRYGDAIKNTVKIADMCNFEFTFGKTVLPVFTPPDGLSANAYLRRLSIEGLETRVTLGQIVYGEDGETDENAYKARMEYELLVISQMGYSSYYLIVADFVNYAKGVKIPTGPGRGSGAGSLIAFLIGITEVDPIKYGLLFESFLNKERVSMPDFDIDFGDRRRHEVIDYVTEKYGENKVCQITTFGTLASKGALRDVGRVMGMPYSEVDAVVKALPEVKGGISLSEAINDPSFKEVYLSSPDVTRLIDTAMKLEGIPRNASTHAAGVVITANDLSDYVPLAVNGDMTVTQYDMDTVAKLGLLKFDFLALRYLSVEDDTVNMIKNDLPSFDINKIPLDDEKTFELISSGLTDGVFQLEAGGMRRFLQKMKPRKITDLMVAIALYRPGPMDSIPTYLKNRENGGDYGYKIKGLEPILDETCGCIVYQEQVMQIFSAVAGYSYARADVVRRAIAKKKPGVIEEHRSGFVNGAVERGHDKNAAIELFDSMVSFSNYAFKKSHSVAYGLICYHTAYLKTHFPEYYYSALLTSVYDDLPKMGSYMTECKKRGIKVLPPDINESETYFSAKDGAIRFGLCAIKGIGESFTDKVVAKRKLSRYKSFDEFVSRNSQGEAGKKAFEGLIKAGAFDSLGKNRRCLLTCLADVCERHSKLLKAGMEGQIGLFDSEGDGEYAYPDVEDFSLKERLYLEKESCGIYLTGSPLDAFSKQIEYINPTPISSVPDLKDKTRISLCGTVTKRVDKATKNGQLMLFSGLEDGFFEIELVVFPTVVENCGYLFNIGNGLLINGEVSVSERGSSVIVRTAEPLIPNASFVPPQKKVEQKAPPVSQKPPAATQEKSGNRLYLRVNDLNCEEYKRASAVCAIFDGRTEVSFFDSSSKSYVPSGTTDGSAFVINELKAILGEDNVVIK